MDFAREWYTLTGEDFYYYRPIEHGSAVSREFRDIVQEDAWFVQGEVNSEKLTELNMGDQFFWYEWREDSLALNKQP